jgi:hypothetical protein
MVNEVLLIEDHSQECVLMEANPWSYIVEFYQAFTPTYSIEKCPKMATGWLFRSLSASRQVVNVLVATFYVSKGYIWKIPTAKTRPTGKN